MEIIKKGWKDFMSKEFECGYCGCVFKANKNEYQIKNGGRNDTYYVCKCPCCGNEVCRE